MTTPTRKSLIRKLAADADEIRRPARVEATAIFWGLASILVAGLLILGAGPLREGSVYLLGQSPRYALENVFAVLAIAGFSLLAFRSAVPAADPRLRWTIAPFVLLAAWVAAIAFDLVSPAIEPSMNGKREGCIFEVLLYGLPGLALGLALLRRWWPLHAARSGLLLGLAAGGIPALIMQFSCMYLPAHMLTHHLLPGIALGPLGALAGLIWLRRK